MDTLTIEALIAEGNEILEGIKYIPSSPNVFRTFSVYQLADESVYERWKNIVIRFLSTNYPDDISSSDLRKAAEEFEKKYYSPTSMKKMLGILEAFKAIPTPITSVRGKTTPSIVINNSNSQSQEQSQNFDFLIKSIEDAFTISQLKELRQIVNEENGNLEKAKPKLMEKIKSFGSNLASNIVANILTNPVIWSSIS
ncbi:MAG: peptide chain release factor 1 [Prevotella sp.]|nr:peptide chain release factor 1 [Prevotella sp.]